jgi:peptidoglycan/LPS O-acetylase OafA/YrhL
MISTNYTDSKQHFEILDGLRGVAAITVVAFHIFEAFALGDHHRQIINHGYLAVDFFFALSGYVIGYAYDDRWANMSLKAFSLRRLIRLHPLIILGMVVGAVLFYPSASPKLFKLIDGTPVWQVVVLMFYGFTLIPLSPKYDIRGWSEMHPLNGPAWTLFFEYIGNILYALVLRRLPNLVLSMFTILAAAATIHLALTSPSGTIVGGWSIEPIQLRIGFTRLMYPFLIGLLLSRTVKPGKINQAFLLSSLMIFTIMACPRIGGNGLYEAFSVIFLFPLIVYIGASGEVKGKFAKKACRFLGEISYPIYITHYPLIYIYTAWVVNHKITLAEGWPQGLLVFFGSILLAYIGLRFYDIPTRKWLVDKLLKR